ncbi:MAG: ribonuclease P [Methanotrichaceae archaeon]|nr:ribonuclease P [Methanotrichaceae archaeon]
MAKKRRGGKRGISQARKLSLERIVRLFELAEEEHILHPERSNRYVQMARRISTRVRIRIPSHLKRLFCKHCGCYLSPSKARTRLREGRLTVTCLGCGLQMRYPYR